MDTGFSSYHPLTQFIYFAAVLSVCMFIMNPILLGISLLSAAAYVLYSAGINAFLKLIRLNVITSAMIIIINPLISHRGITPILTLPDGNKLTLEALIFGISAALMLSSITAWFYSINRIFNSEKVMWLFGRISPKLALFLSMTLNFISKFSARFRQVRAAQFPLGYDTATGKKKHRIRKGIRILSVMIGWSLENSVDTADSMKSRGYGSAKRSFYSIFTMRKKDYIVIASSIIISAGIFVMRYFGAADYSYYPYFEIVINGISDIAVIIVYIILCLFPIIIDIREDCHWRSIRSAI